eukprot:4499470-Ditylum_brightwellii.AAC.1
MDLTKSLSLGMRNINDKKEKKVMVDAIICANDGWEGDLDSSYFPGRVLEEDGTIADMVTEEWGKHFIYFDNATPEDRSAICKSIVISMTHVFNIGKVTRTAMVEFEPVVTDSSFCLAFDSPE